MSYINYFNKDQIKELNQNVWYASDATIADGTTGRHLYKHDTRHPSYSICSDDVRDKDFQYIIWQERDDHPDHTSRFGYARAPYGYLTGHWPGKYQESALCSSYNPQPEDMSPERFYYNSQCGDPGQSISQGDIWAHDAKIRRMRIPPWWGPMFEETGEMPIIAESS